MERCIDFPQKSSSTFDTNQIVDLIELFRFEEPAFHYAKARRLYPTGRENTGLCHLSPDADAVWVYGYKAMIRSDDPDMLENVYRGLSLIAQRELESFFETIDFVLPA